MKKSKKLTENQFLYKKERKRIQQALRRLHSRGYRFFGEDVIPTVEQFIDKPKRITKKFLEKMKEFTPKNIAKQGEFFTNKGEKLTGEQGLEFEKQQRIEKIKQQKKQKENNITQTTEQPTEQPTEQSAEQPQPFEHFSELIINKFLGDFTYLGYEVNDLLSKWIDICIKNSDINSVAKMLQDGIYQQRLERSLLPYKLNEALTFISRTMAYLNMPDDLKSDIMDILNSYADELYSEGQRCNRKVYR